MANNNNLTQAKKIKNDEFYTQYLDIQNEINAYLEYNSDTFRNKVVLLPCDDPEWSNFTRFFAQNFETLGLKKLISTSYATESKNKGVPVDYQFSIEDYLTDFEKSSTQYDESITGSRGKIFTLTRKEAKKIDIDDLEWKYLEGDGDFRSEEVTKLRDEADIIVTNPPFSKFREFVLWITEANKSFIIVGAQNAISYKEVFPLIKGNKLWIGNGFSHGDAYFRVFSENKKDYAAGVFDNDNNLVKFRNCTWFTNLEHGRRHIPLSLMSEEDNIKFSKHKEVKNIGYFKYVNYDAIEVKYVDSIPSDYDGVIGVPVTFLDKYCPEQFEIIGSVDADILPEGWKGLSQDFIDLYYSQGNTGALREGNRLAGYIDNDGKAIVPYKRILIRKKVIANENNS